MDNNEQYTNDIETKNEVIFKSEGFIIPPKSFNYDTKKMNIWNEFWTNLAYLYNDVVQFHEKNETGNKTVGIYNFVIRLLAKIKLLNHIVGFGEISSGLFTHTSDSLESYIYDYSYNNLNLLFKKTKQEEF